MSTTKICTRCVCDTTIPGIRFDDRGVCNYCELHDELERSYPQGELGKERLEKIVDKIRASGRGLPYDCVAGVSGGRDSTYTLYTAVRLGLRPLAVHFDNGWNSATAVTNIKNSLDALGVDLVTVVADWEEFRDLQLAFLRASVSDSEIPTDIAIFGSLHEVAAKHNLRYILNGHSFRTEGVMPIGWTYMDGRYIASVHSRFGQLRSLGSIPNFTITDFVHYTFLRRITTIPLLNYVRYDRPEAQAIMENELGWTYYGGHHHESHFTRFFQSYLLPKKFGIDKRKIEYSALVRSGQMSREVAHAEIHESPYPYDQDIVDYVVQKLRLTDEEFQEMMEAPRKSFHDYPTYYPLVSAVKVPLRIGAQLGLVPKLLYYKLLT